MENGTIVIIEIFKTLNIKNEEGKATGEVMNRNDIEKEIIDREWAMFQEVNGIDGRADCQDENSK